MELSAEQIHGLGIALDEATLLGVEVSPERQLVGTTFSVLTLPEEGPAPSDSRVQIIFKSAQRVAASLRLGRWDDKTAKVEQFKIDQLLEIAQSFKCPIYGWEFFNLDTRRFDWLDRLSLDWRNGNDGSLNSFTFSQDGGTRHLDICIWFGELSIRRPDGTELTMEEFITGGKRWWDGLYAGDSRTNGSGIFPIQ